jgi:VanZ family protein
MSNSAAQPDQHRRLRMLAVVAVLYWLLMTYLMHMPLKQQPHVPDDGIPKDKSAHFALYGGLAVCLISVLEQRSRVDSTARPRRELNRNLAVMTFCTAHGVIEEITQPLTGRKYEISDLLADFIGASLGLVCYFVASKVFATMRGRASES